MPRRSVLSAAERESLLALPDNRDDLIRRYTLSESDLSIIRQRRGAANRLGFAVQLCYLRFPGVVLGVDQLPFAPLLHLVANQLGITVDAWADYGGRAETRREHLGDLQTVFGFEPFTTGHHRLVVQELIETARRTDKGSGSRSITPTRPASPTMCSPSCICSASASLPASAMDGFISDQWRRSAEVTNRKAPILFAKSGNPRIL
jgi:hypothetical protein